MANSHTTLASLWVDDGQGSPIKVTPTTPSKTELGDDLKKFYKDTGLDVFAKESGIMDANGDLTGFKDTGKARASGVSYVAVPIPNTPMKTSSPFKDQPQLLPKTINAQAQGSPMMMAASPHASVVTVDSPWSARKRGAELTMDPSDYSDGYGSGKRAKKGEKGGKGLRHFSMKVCEKVQKKGVTSYNEVADELVAEFTDPRNPQPPSDQALAYDQKNIRRRVYDALNVLMAMNIISKEKKEIRWIGLPTNSAQECQNLERERQTRLEKIRLKTQQLQELILQQIAFKNLVQRNRDNEKRNDIPAPNSSIHLPFIIISTNKKTVIDCSISNDKYEYLFTFDNMFEIHDDIEVLKRMGMAFGLEKGQCSAGDLAKAVKLVPRSLESYVHDMATNSNVLPSREIRPIDPATLSVHHATRCRQGASTSTYSAVDMDSEVAAASASILSRQSSVCSDLPSRTATDTPSENYSEDEESDDDDMDMV